MEYYSSVFTFDDWYLDKPVGTIAQQYDHLSRSLLVAGNLPDGYIWHMLVQCGDNFNIVLMEPIEDTASTVANLPEEDGEPEKKPKLIGAVLERGWVGESGKYSVQLRGVKGEEVRHTNLITIRIPKSMAGEAQWPEVPSEFTQIEHRVNETYERVKNMLTARLQLLRPTLRLTPMVWLSTTMLRALLQQLRPMLRLTLMV